jgi:molybdopterin synthase sulfur carrier subunit
MTLKMLYFAWVRERIGTGEEGVSPPPEVTDVSRLLRWLAHRSPGHGEALADLSRLRVAIDGDHVSHEAPLDGAREVSIFPPVTGG